MNAHRVRPFPYRVDLAFEVLNSTEHHSEYRRIVLSNPAYSAMPYSPRIKLRKNEQYCTERCLSLRNEIASDLSISSIHPCSTTNHTARTHAVWITHAARIKPAASAGGSGASASRKQPQKKQGGLEDAEKVVVLKGRDFSPARKSNSISVALATEGMSAEPKGIFSKAK